MNLYLYEPTKQSYRLTEKSYASLQGPESEATDSLQGAIRGVSGVSIGRGKGKFVLPKLAFWSTLGGQVCNFVLVSAKTG